MTPQPRTNAAQTAIEKAKLAAAEAAAKASTEQPTVEGTVIEVKPAVKKKSNDNEYMVAIVETDKVNEKTGQKIRIAAMCTTKKVRGEDGELLVDESGNEAPVRRNMVDVGQTVTLYLRVVTNDDGSRVMHADIQTGGATDNSDEDAIAALGF